MVYDAESRKDQTCRMVYVYHTGSMSPNIPHTLLDTIPRIPIPYRYHTRYAYHTIGVRMHIPYRPYPYHTGMAYHTAASYIPGIPTPYGVCIPYAMGWYAIPYATIPGICAYHTGGIRYAYLKLHMSGATPFLIVAESNSHHIISESEVHFC